MKTNHLYPIIAGLLLTSMTSLFAFPSFDPFADASGSGGTVYNAGDLLGGKKNAFGDSWSTINSTSTGTGPVDIASGSLTLSYDTFPSDFYPTTPGNSVELKNVVSKGARLNLGQTFTTNAVYYSFIMKADNVTSLSTAAVGTFMIALNSGTGAASGGYSDNYNAEIRMKRDTTLTSSYFIGVSKNSPASSDVVYAPTEYGINDTLFVVVAHDYVTDKASIWVNPMVSTFAQASPPSATAAVTTPALSAATGTVQTALSQINSLVLMDRIATQPNHMVMDDVRVGTTWMYVTGGPEIGTQPAGTVTGNAGTTTTISVAARSGNSSSLTYNWQKNGANITDGNVSGTTSATLTISSALAANDGNYTCVVGNSVGTVTSSAAAVTINDPYITTQPVATQQVPPGGTATMSLVAAGTAPITYQWKKGGVNLSNGLQPSGSTVSGSTSATLTITGMTLGDADTYTCAVTNAALASVTSSNSILQVQDPSITSQPVDAAKQYGDTATFQVAAAGTTPLSYQWQRNGVNLTEGAATAGGGTATGVQTATLSLTSVAFADAGSYSCVVSNGVGASASSTNAVLTVQDPIFMAQPASASVVQGNSTNFAVTAAGSGTINYQWYKGSTALANGTGIVGSTTATLSLSSITSSQAGNYKCVIVGADSLSRTSSVAVLTVFVPPTITEAPANRALRVGDHTALTVVASGTAPLSYQWSNSGGPIANATSSVLSFANLALSDSDTYTVVVTNSVGTATASAVVNVSNNQRAFTANNIVVSRLGDGSQPLIATNGNTIYIDQYTSGGNYVSSLMIPDTGADALVAAGQDSTGGTLGLGEACLTPTPDGSTLALSGYNVARPYNSSSFISSDNASVAPRGVGLISGLGGYQLGLRVTSSSITGGFRAAVTDNTQTNFWLVGGNLSIRYFNTGSTGAGTIIATGGTSGNNRYVGIFNGDIFADAATTGGGIYDISGLAKSSSTATQIITYPTVNLVNEFALSPDGNTIYLATGAINSSSGTGIERWDKTGSSWTSNAVFSTGVGARGLVVDWSGFSGGGSTGTGATVYFTTAETNDNKLVQLLDNGTATLNVLAKSGTNSVFRSVKLAPTALPPSIATQPADTTVECGSNAVLTVTASGSAPFSYQWYTPDANGTAIAGATDSSYTVNSASGVTTYAVVVTNAVGSATSSTATVTAQDTTAPVVTLNGSDMTVECHGTFTDPGATATDSCDAHPSVTTSGSVNINAAGSYTLTYTATDAANNASSAYRTVTVNDTTPPVITVLGPTSDTACIGNPYPDPGATASDTCAGVVTLSTNNPVNTAVAGDYTITYTAQDATGNSSTATRVVSVIQCATPIAITTQPVSQLHQPQGTNVTLTVAASGSPLNYQWYENNVAIQGANNASFNFAAQPDQVTGTNLTFYVVVSNSVSQVQSDVVSVNIIIDKVKPTLTLISPANNNRATSFTVKGKVTDSKGNGALLKYYWTALPLTTPPAQTATYTIDISNVGTTPSSRDFSATGFPLQNPTDAGTNQLTIWTEDLAGNDSSPVKNVKVFYQVPHTYALTISGDGTGTVAVSTKGAAHETVTGAPTGTIVGSANHTYNLTLFARQDYTFKFTADPKADKPTVGVSVGSVVSNALPAQAAGTTTTKPVSITFEAANADASANVSFDRNRFLDMAGTYTGVFSGTPNAPTKDNSRQFVLTVSPTRTVSGYLLDANKAKTTIPPKTSLRDDGSITVAIGSITVSGSLGWTGSENATGIKQFVGTATDGNWTAQLTADKEDKTALPTDGFATMQIPGGFAGNGFATIKSKNGVVTATYTLADDDKHPIVMAVTGSRSGNIPQWVINTHSGSLLFGNLVVGDGLATISAPSLSWIRPANNGVYPSLMPAGFTLAQFAATCSPFNPAQLLSGNYTLSLTGGSLATDINGQAVTFSSSKMAAAGKVKAGSMDANGKLKFTFLDGSTPTHTTIAQGVILQNAGNGAGFFIRTGAADTGVMTLTPVTP